MTSAFPTPPITNSNRDHMEYINDRQKLNIVASKVVQLQAELELLKAHVNMLQVSKDSSSSNEAEEKDKGLTALEKRLNQLSEEHTATKQRECGLRGRIEELEKANNTKWIVRLHKFFAANWAKLRLNHSKGATKTPQNRFIRMCDEPSVLSATNRSPGWV